MTLSIVTFMIIINSLPWNLSCSGKKRRDLLPCQPIMVKVLALIGCFNRTGSGKPDEHLVSFPLYLHLMICQSFIQKYIYMVICDLKNYGLKGADTAESAALKIYSVGLDRKSTEKYLILCGNLLMTNNCW